MGKNAKKNYTIFLIIGFILLFLTSCTSLYNFTIASKYAPLFINAKIIYPSQIAFNLGTTLPIKIEINSKSYSTYPVIIEFEIHSSYQYIIDTYTSFILNIDNQIFYPKFPEEVKNTVYSSLLLDTKTHLFICQPYPQKVNLLYLLNNNIENKKLSIIFNINGNVYFYDL